MSRQLGVKAGDAQNRDAMVGAENWPWHGRDGEGAEGAQGGGLEGLGLPPVCESELLQVQAPNLGLVGDSLADSPTRSQPGSAAVL